MSEYHMDTEDLRVPEQPRKGGCARELLSYVILFIIALVAAMLVRTFIVQPFKIPSGSMRPTIEIGEHVFAEKISYLSRTPERGDIVTFTAPDEPDTYMIKRVIATEGQVIDLVNGAVFVDGEQLDEPYVNDRPTDPFEKTAASVEITYPYTVPDGTVWVMGDNRTNSGDSRFFGPIDADTITARGFFTFWPLSDIGPLE